MTKILQSSKTYLALIWVMAMLITNAIAQVSTLPENKNYLIEKGTGHVCGSCPLLDSRCDTVVDSHPGRGFLILYHFGPDAVPQAPPVNMDFTTPFGDTIYDPAKLGWPFYLNMMVNRRDRGAPYGSTFIFGAVNQVQPEADDVITQASPVNLAMSSSFDEATRLLTVNVEAYYTANSATPLNFIQIALTEDSIIATQYDPAYAPNNHFNLSFVHNNVFRDNLMPFPGDTVASTTAGTLVTRTYTYTIPTMYKNVPCNPENCYLTLYMQEEKASSGIQSFTGKIQTAIRTKVGEGSVGVIDGDIQPTVYVYPNPSTGMVYIKGIETGNYDIEVIDMKGQQIYSNPHKQNTKIDLSQSPKGLYLIKITSPKGISTHKVLLTE